MIVQFSLKIKLNCSLLNIHRVMRLRENNTSSISLIMLGEILEAKKELVLLSPVAIINLGEISSKIIWVSLW